VACLQSEQDNSPERSLLFSCTVGTQARRPAAHSYTPVLGHVLKIMLFRRIPRRLPLHFLALCEDTVLGRRLEQVLSFMCTCSCSVDDGPVDLNSDKAPTVANANTPFPLPINYGNPYLFVPDQLTNR
jgi:hypothetical protein